MRRMLQLEASRGFSSWSEFAQERRRLVDAARMLRNPELSRSWRSWAGTVAEQRQLRRAVARFVSPALSHAFCAWRRRAAAESKRRSREEAKHRLEREAQERMARVEAEKDALLAQLTAVQEQNAHAQQVRQQQALLRILNLEIVRYFSTWMVLALEKQRLRRAAARVRTPGLHTTVARWKQLAALRRARRERDQRREEQAELERIIALKDAEAADKIRLTEALIANRRVADQASATLARERQESRERMSEARANFERELSVRDRDLSDQRNTLAAERRKLQEHLDRAGRAHSEELQRVRRENSQLVSRLEQRVEQSEQESAFRDQAAAKEKRVLEERVASLGEAVEQAKADAGMHASEAAALEQAHRLRDDRSHQLSLQVAQLTARVEALTGGSDDYW